MSKAIIFGANSQDGHYLRKILEEEKIAVTGISRSGGDWIQGDVGHKEFVNNLIRSEKPSLIFHLAANSSVSHELLWEHQHTILKGTLNILESAFESSPDSRVFITGSGLQFENNGDPVKASNPFHAADAYSMARIQSVFAARYFREKGINVKVGYLFHHDSPFRKTRHLNRIIVDAALAVKKKNHPVLEIADTGVEKEFGFAGDIARGIFQLTMQDDLNEACIGTGKAYTIETWLQLCFQQVGANWKDFVKPRTDFVPSFKRLLSDPSDMFQIGWRPELSIEGLANMMMQNS